MTAVACDVVLLFTRLVHADGLGGGGVRELGDRRICMTSRMLMVVGPTTLAAHRCRLGSGQCVG